MRFRNLKAVHWIIFALAFWIIIGPFVADAILRLLLDGDVLDEIGVISLLRWDDFFIGLAISVLALVVVSLEQPSIKTAGLRAMHWLQVGLGAWIATAPFALDFTYAQFTWSHFVTGFFVAIFALIQLNLEDAKH
ncbi:SPW repeat protein [Candidatus Uhrbacteria bacterium]|nr:SPW repeat protein [Candidatus Uhrbacteria bacterium]